MNSSRAVASSPRMRVCALVLLVPFIAVGCSSTGEIPAWRTPSATAHGGSLREGWTLVSVHAYEVAATPPVGPYAATDPVAVAADLEQLVRFDAHLVGFELLSTRLEHECSVTIWPEDPDDPLRAYYLQSTPPMPRQRHGPSLQVSVTPTADACSIHWIMRDVKGRVSAEETIGLAEASVVLLVMPSTSPDRTLLLFLNLATGDAADRPLSMANARPRTLEEFFRSPLSHESAFGTILTGDLPISPEFDREDVVLEILGFLKREPNAMGTAIGSPDFEDTRVRSVDFWAVVLQEVTGVQSDGPINTRVAPSVRDQSIRGLVSKVEMLRGDH